ncbi:hypothetical protein [Mesorhizobium sp. ES1-1]|uniref:hypothetical protein n=1 Tax=Mesorhizobium sp. ES1-1 TaxID=2876629 RepID=UPI001CCA8FAC|nr:hypothetical protein [Mesorhizobium sp. ES1-1]MBZ9678895.1 hypothetical protein [Mesorhizobium sp. ES1-1]
MTQADKPYSEPLGGSYTVDKPGAKPVRVAFTEHHRNGAPLAADTIVSAEPEPAVTPVADKKGK